MKKHANNHQSGFTLLEYIVVLVIAAIMAAIVSTYFGSALTQSGVPIGRLQQASKLQQVMEKIVADYKRLNALNLRFVWQASMPYTVDSVVVPSTSNGHYYKCITAGTSGTTEPTWPTTSGGTVTDGTVTWTEVADGTVRWTEAGTILARTGSAITGSNNDPVLNDNLYYYLTTNPSRYSSGYAVTYTVTTNFIQFANTGGEVTAGASSTSSEKNILKVIITSNSTNETLTELFTIR